jgi:hypothetical protein
MRSVQARSGAMSRCSMRASHVDSRTQLMHVRMHACVHDALCAPPRTEHRMIWNHAHQPHHITLREQQTENSQRHAPALRQQFSCRSRIHLSCLQELSSFLSREGGEPTTILFLITLLFFHLPLLCFPLLCFLPKSPSVWVLAFVTRATAGRFQIFSFMRSLCLLIFRCVCVLQPMNDLFV